MKTTCWALLLPWLFLLVGLSSLSAYDVTRVGTINFEIATMLTPWGLIRTFLLGLNEELRPYYFESPGFDSARFESPSFGDGPSAPPRTAQSLWSSTQLLFWLTMFLFQSFSFWLLWKLRRNRP